MTVAQLIERLRAFPQDLPACVVDGQMGGLVAESARVGEAYVDGKIAPAVLIGEGERTDDPPVVSGASRPSVL